MRCHSYCGSLIHRESWIGGSVGTQSADEVRHFELRVWLALRFCLCSRVRGEVEWMRRTCLDRRVLFRSELMLELQQGADGELGVIALLAHHQHLFCFALSFSCVIVSHALCGSLSSCWMGRLSDPSRRVMPNSTVGRTSTTSARVASPTLRFSAARLPV